MSNIVNLSTKSRAKFLKREAAVVRDLIADVDATEACECEHCQPTAGTGSGGVINEGPQEREKQLRRRHFLSYRNTPFRSDKMWSSPI